MQVLTRRFIKSDKGSIALVVALLVPVIIGIIALTVDLTSHQAAKMDNDSATDSAAKGLAEAVAKSRADNITMSDGQLKEYAYNLWSQNSQKDQGFSKNKKAESFSATLDGDTVTVKSCPTVDGFTVAGDKQVCAESLAYVSCIPLEEEKTEACPSGNVGEILKKRVIQCPSGKWSSWLTKKDTCTSSCTPTNETYTIPCPAGTSGAGITMARNVTCPKGDITESQLSYACNVPCAQKTETRQRQCSVVLNNTGATGIISEQRTSSCPSGIWGSWVQTSSSCCVPDEETRQRACDTGFAGSISEKRTKTCPANTWGSWIETENTCKSTTPDKVDMVILLDVSENMGSIVGTHTTSEMLTTDPSKQIKYHASSKKIYAANAAMEAYINYTNKQRSLDQYENMSEATRIATTKSDPYNFLIIPYDKILGGDSIFAGIGGTVRVAPEKMFFTNFEPLTMTFVWLRINGFPGDKALSSYADVQLALKTAIDRILPSPDGNAIYGGSYQPRQNSTKVVTIITSGAHENEPLTQCNKLKNKGVIINVMMIGEMGVKDPDKWYWKCASGDKTNKSDHLKKVSTAQDILNAFKDMALY